MKKLFKTIIFLIIFFVFFSINSYAANLSINIDFNGKEIKMTAENPNIEFNIEDLKPGESRENTVILNSIGDKEIIAEINSISLEKNELLELIYLKIINNKTNEILYDGNLNEFQKAEVKIPAKETNSLNIITTFPVIAENTVEKIDSKITIKIVAKGEKIINKNENNPEENQIEYITTETINQIKKSESYVIYIVLAIMVTVLIFLIIAFIKNK